MKATHKTTTAITMFALLGLPAAVEAGPDGRSQGITRHLDSLTVSGSSGGDKLNRTAGVGNTAMSRHLDSLRKEGSAPGDHIDRTVRAILPKQMEPQSMGFRIAPVK